MKPVVLWDLGDVLVRLSFERGLARLRALGATTAMAEPMALIRTQASLDCNAGRLSGAAFLEALAAHLGCPDAPPAELHAAWCDVFEPWPEMERLAADVLDAGHATWLLSNTDPLHFACLRPRLPVLERFSGLFLSYEAGLLKPDPAYFSAALQRIGVPAARCLFVDDRADNVAAARACGLQAAQHTGEVEAVRHFLRGAGVAI